MQSKDQDVTQLQYNIAQVVEPLTEQPLAYGNLIRSVVLAVGDNSVNHLLGQMLTGWIITRQRGSADIYDNQSNNSSAATTLILNSSAAVTVDIYVF